MVKDGIKTIKLNFFKWRSTGVLFLGVVLMIASMNFEKESQLSIEAFTLSKYIIWISMGFIIFKWIFDVFDEIDKRRKK